MIFSHKTGLTRGKIIVQENNGEHKLVEQPQ